MMPAPEDVAMTDAGEPEIMGVEAAPAEAEEAEESHSGPPSGSASDTQSEVDSEASVPTWQPDWRWYDREGNRMFFASDWDRLNEGGCLT